MQWLLIFAIIIAVLAWILLAPCFEKVGNFIIKKINDIFGGNKNE